jgi:hypothetical protein
VPIFSASTALPYEHRARATAGLVGVLHHRLLDEGGGEMPDWSTLTVAGPVVTVDARGRTSFEYAATVESRAALR